MNGRVPSSKRCKEGASQAMAVRQRRPDGSTHRPHSCQARLLPCADGALQAQPCAAGRRTSGPSDSRDQSREDTVKLAEPPPQNTCGDRGGGARTVGLQSGAIRRICSSGGPRHGRQQPVWVPAMSSAQRGTCTAAGAAASHLAHAGGHVAAHDKGAHPSGVAEQLVAGDSFFLGGGGWRARGGR